MAYQDHFGFIPELSAFEFEGGEISAAPTLGEGRDWVGRYANPDGHLYPPCGRADSQASVFLWRLPISHELKLAATSDVEEPRYHAAGFLIHFLGVLYGHRCQFLEWWIDGRCELRGNVDYIIVREGQLAACVNRALATWRGLDPTAQRMTINALFLHSRTIVYQNEWERFQAEYQVLDALYSIARRSGQIGGPRRHRHSDRLKAICHRYGLAEDSARVDYFVDLRNALVHDALWDGGTPGDAGSLDSFYASLSLHKLARRAAFAMLGLRGEYLSSPWWFLGTQPFDLA